MANKLKQRRKVNLAVHGLFIVLFAFLAAYVFQHAILAAPNTVAIPSTIPQCTDQGGKQDQATNLANFINSQPSGTTINFPNSGCYTLNSILKIQDPNATGITVNGNGTQLVRNIANDQYKFELDPYMIIAQDNDINVNGLTINGTYNDNPSLTICGWTNPPEPPTDDCTNGGDGEEGHVGLFVESDTNATITNMHFNDIEGDCLSIMGDQSQYMNPSYPETLNYNTVVTNSTFNGCGYTGLSIENSCGTTIQDNEWKNVYEDGIDFEVDFYSTDFDEYYPKDTNQNPGCLTREAVPGHPASLGYIPTGGVQDNITIANNTWDNDNNADWFTSQQGQYPGVEQDNVVLTGNTIIGGGSTGGQDGLKIDVLGTPLKYTDPRYWNDGLTIKNNTACSTDPQTNKLTCLKTEDLTGGSVADKSKPVGSAIQIVNVANLNISGNTDPLIDGYPPYSNTPYLAGVTLKNNIDGIINPQQCSNDSRTHQGPPQKCMPDATSVDVAPPVLQNNHFTNAYDTVNSLDSGDNAKDMIACGNTYWLNDSDTDSICSSPPSVPTNLQASAAGPTSVNLSWTASTPNGQYGLGGYYIYQDNSTTPTYTVNSQTATSYPVNGLTPNTTYSYTIAAYDSNSPADVSAQSAPQSVSTQSEGPPPKVLPSTPTNVKATVVETSMSAKTYKVVLTWSPSTDAGGPGIYGYNVLRDGTWYHFAGNVTRFTDSAVSAGQTYSYTVRALDKSTPTHNYSAISDSSTVTIGPSSLGISVNPQPVISVIASQQLVLCPPPGLNVSDVTGVTYSVDGQSVTTANNQLCTYAISPASLNSGTNVVAIGLHNKNGTTANYSQNLNILPTSSKSKLAYWSVIIVITLVIITDFTWLYIKPPRRGILDHNIESDETIIKPSR